MGSSTPSSPHPLTLPLAVSCACQSLSFLQSNFLGSGRDLTGLEGYGVEAPAAAVGHSLGTRSPRSKPAGLSTRAVSEDSLVGNELASPKHDARVSTRAPEAVLGRASPSGRYVQCTRTHIPPFAPHKCARTHTHTHFPTNIFSCLQANKKVECNQIVFFVEWNDRSVGLP